MLVKNVLSLCVFLFSFQIYAQVDYVKLKGAHAAVFDRQTNSIYVAAGNKGVWKVDSKSLEINKLQNIQDTVDLLVLRKHQLISISPSYPGERGVRSTLSLSIKIWNPRNNAHLEQEKNIILDNNAHSASLLDEKTLILLSGSTLSTYFVDLDSGRISNKVSRPLDGISYGGSGIDVKDNTLYLPGGYPGQIVSLKKDPATNKISVEHQEIYDWIHDIKKVSENSFLSCGHIEGVTLITGKGVEFGHYKKGENHGNAVSIAENGEIFENKY